MFRLPFKVYEEVFALRKYDEIKKKLENVKLSVLSKIVPTCYIKSKVIDFAYSKKLFRPSSMSQLNLEQFIIRIKSPLTKNCKICILR